MNTTTKEEMKNGNLLQEANELTAIFAATHKTAKLNARRKNSKS